ncbi:phosphatidate cytidylyltransferase [Spirochaetia bacterium]|nr:phosphatidate cytidylyltransferase [Spirochaetia bacterium]
MEDIRVQKNWSMAFAAAFPDVQEVKTELVRKTLHFLIALSPSMAALNRPLTMVLLMTGVLFYTGMESLRLAGINVPLISRITSRASRARDQGRFVLGPVTLGMGALMALLLYPSPAASIAIYALAFGDGFASLIGKFFGRIRPAFLYGKSLEGSLACFTAVFISAWQVSRSYKISFLAAFSATLVEALPLEDYDNMALPIAVGLIVSIAML